MKHELHVARRTLGRSPIQGSRTRYGTNAKCTCQHWTSFTNDKTPSGGGQRWAEQAHEKHVANTTTQTDIETLNSLLATATRKLTEAIADQDTWGLEVYGPKVGRLTAELAADLRKLDDEIREAGK